MKQSLPVGPFDRWRWYHYYFLLTLIDLLVIIAGVWLFHEMGKSYETAFHRLGATHTRLRWVANLRLMVMRLNAPGNDVFDTGWVAEERDRFEKAHRALHDELSRRRKFDLDMVEFEEHLRRMTDEEQRLFDLLEDGALEPGSRASDRLAEAARAMAVMDRHQTAAVTALTEIEQNLLIRVEELLEEHGAQIRGQVLLERLFIAVIGLILIGMFWYGGKLQHVYDQMVVDNERAVSERMQRLAAVGEVCAAVAHGIRNPLAAISSSAQLGLMSGVGDGKLQSRLTDILSECQRLDQRVTHLLDFSSAASTARGVFSLREAVEQAVDELRPRLAERDVSVDVSFSVYPKIDADRERIIQSIIELLANALDFSPPGERILIECIASLERPGSVDLTVSDCGPGIPPEVASRVFDLFFTTRPGGTGVGLASVLHTVHSHGGDVAIISSPGGGTTVRLTLPCARLQSHLDIASGI